MANIADTIKEVVKDRIKNPIFGSFILSWVVINWRAILHLLYSDMKIQARIVYIEGYFSTETHWPLLTTPLLTSLGLVIGTQFLNIPYHLFKEWILYKVKSKRLSLEVQYLKKEEKNINDRNIISGRIDETKTNVALELKQNELENVRKQIEEQKEIIENNNSAISENKSLKAKLNSFQTGINEVKNEVALYTDSRKFDEKMVELTKWVHHRLSPPAIDIHPGGAIRKPPSEIIKASDRNLVGNRKESEEHEIKHKK